MDNANFTETRTGLNLGITVYVCELQKKIYPTLSMITNSNVCVIWDVRKIYIGTIPVKWEAFIDKYTFTVPYEVSDGVNY